MNQWTYKSLAASLAFWLLLGFVSIGFSPEAQATHLMGSDLTYEQVSGNQYRVTLTLYRDCNGINLGTSQPLSVVGCGITTNYTLPVVSQTEITPVCPGVVGSACLGTGVYGIQKFVYQSVITLNANCTGPFNLRWMLCCRNNAITTLANPGSNEMMISTTIFHNPNITNHSPVFLNNPTPFACNNQPVFYNHGAFDQDGDSLVFSLAPCLRAGGAVVTYGAGFSPTAPLATTNGVSIDRATGGISFTPNRLQVGVLCVLVEEYRNGVKIGEIVRDIQFTVLNCTNTAPLLTGINGSTDFTATTQVGQQLCFNVLSSDPDADQTVDLRWNAAIPGASFNSDGSNRPTGRFCWTPTQPGTYSFTVTVFDNACPLIGQNTYTYTIIVTQPTPPPPPPCNVSFSLVSTHDLRCAPNDGGAVITASGGTAPYTYQLVNWTSNTFFSNQTGIFNNLTAGNYGILVVDANGCTPSCAGGNFSIGGNATPLTATVNSQSPLCAGNNGGSISVQATGGTAPYLFSLNGGNFQSNGQFQGLASGSYQIAVLDANGCSYTENVRIVAPAPLVAVIGTVSQPTCGQNNGQISIAATGGTAPYTFSLNGQTSTVGMFSGLGGGNYLIAITDANQCSAQVTATLVDAPGIVASATATNPSCHGDCDGTASVTATGGSGSLSFTWSNGASGANLSDLCGGTYTVTIRDGAGCEVSQTVQVVEPAALDLSLASSVNPSCNQSNGSAQLQATGGTAPYTFQLANFSQGVSATNNSGSFSNLGVGLYAAQIVDANGCAQSCATQFSLRSDCNGTRDTRNVSLSNTSSSYFLLSPNPASTLVQASYAVEAKSVQINVIDETGRSLYTQNNLPSQGSHEIMVQSWTGGHYFVILRNEEGKVLSTQKLVLKR